MYVAQITLPVVDKENSKGFSNQPDMYVTNQIFGLLHKNAYLVDKKYKYCLGFPELSNTKFGTIIQVFSSNLDELKKLLKTDVLYETIADHCNVKFVKVNLELLKNKDIKTYKIKRTKDDCCISISEIKRIIKRGSETSEIVKKAKNGMSIGEIYDEIKSQKNNKKSYLQYRTEAGDNAIFFLEKKYCNENINFQAKTNSFGLSNDIVLPEVVF